VVIGRLFFVQAIKGSEYAQKANSQQSRKFEIPAQRGLIYLKESNGLYPVALNTEVYTLAVDPSFVKDKDKTANEISQVVNIDKKEIEKKLSAKNRYVELSKAISTEDAEKIKSLSLPGVLLQKKASRYYPEGPLFAQILGYVNDDGEGQYGFEQFSNGALTGDTGQYNTVTDSLGIPINTVENTLVEPKDGKNYALTLDRGLQSVASDALLSAIETNRAESGSIIVMDVETGEIKAMVNYPSYDPNDFRSVKDYTLFSNRAVSGLFEPGSGFKAITMAAALDAKKVTPETKYNDLGEVTVSGKTIRNSENKKYGIQNMTDVIQKSLNTGMVFVLEMLGSNQNAITLSGKQLLFDYIEKFGFGKVTGIEVAGEVSSKVKPANTYDIDYANISFGQGISVNSLQLLASVGAIANKGVLVKPTIVAGEVNELSQVVPAKSTEVRKVISEESASQTAQMMTQVVEKGSGYLTRMKGYKIAGKTGTAQVPRADGKGYEENKNIGSFVGFAPADDPKFVMLVRIDYPKVEGFAEKTAVPAFAVVAKELFKYYKIAPSGN
jgi:cell division protein FtsI/penicillin-binding protein 2